MTRYLGRAAGAVLGLAGGVPGVVFGLLVGWLLDQVRSRRAHDEVLVRFLENPESVGRRYPSEKLAGIALLVAVASADGGPRESHMAQLFDELGWLLPEQTRSAKRQARVQVHNILPHSREIRTDTIAAFLAQRLNDSGKEAIVASMVRVAAADSGGISSAERVVLRRVSQDWGIAPLLVKDWERLAPGLDHKALQIIGVSSAIEMDELRSVYHELARQFHPDTGMPLDSDRQEQMAGAFRQVRDAYELLSDQLRERARAWG